MIILMPLIFNILYALVNELKTKYEDRQKANKFPSYKAIREELNQTEKSLQAIEKEIDDKEVRTIQIKSGAKKISEELESLEKDIKDNSSDKDITEELMERVINVREKMRNSLAVASEIDKNIKEQKEKIIIGYHRTNVSKRKLLYGRFINILFYFILTIIILITCFFLIRSDLNLYAYLIIGPIAMTLVNKWLIKRERYLNTGLFLILFFIVFSYIIGFNSSTLQEKYITFKKDNENYVVLTVYNDRFLYVPLDNEKKEIKSKFNFVEIDELSDFNFSKIGRITLQKN